jgi:SAM-dependent methyltransferase
MVNNMVKPIEAQAWQPNYIASHHSEQSRYLEAAAASSFVQQGALKAMQLLALKTGQRVLEVGCGNGLFLPRLATSVGSGGRVVGIDLSDAFVAEARQRMREKGFGPSVSIEQGDATKLPFADNSFDAAHCERVLMHLDAPNAALREMIRVVRPGGVIVAAEPDWGGFRLDHPDRAAFDLVFARALKMRQADMGLTLYRRMGEVGLTDRKYLPMFAVIDDLATIKMYGLDLAPAADALASEGVLRADRLYAVVPALEDANSKKRFYSTLSIHVVSGVVPA